MEEKVTFVNDSWCYLTKTVNLNNFTINYTMKRGFASKEIAEASKKIDDDKYDCDINQIKKISNIQFTFKEFVLYWLSDHFLKITESCTKTIGIWVVNHLILPAIEQDVLLNFVTADFINDILKRCIPVCDSAGEASLKYMRKIVRDAYAFGFLQKDLTPELINIKRKIPHIKLLTKPELKLLLQEASKHPGYYFEILMALFAGLRSGEIRGLRYDDFDHKNHTVSVARQFTANYSLADNNGHYYYTAFMEDKEPKASSHRILRIPDFLFDELDKKKAFNDQIIKHRSELGDIDLDVEYISLSPYGRRKKKGTLLSALKRTCNYAGVPSISFHSLRHHFATMLLEKGVPLENISELLGHKSPLTTFNIYCGIIDAFEETKQVINTMVPYLGEGDLNA